MSRDSTALEAAFISANAAGYIASTYTADVKGTRPSTIILDAASLRSLNAFLDYLLAIIIKEARSIELHQLKATFARVLDSALGYVALNEAQAELETYRNQETGASRGTDDERPTSNTDVLDFDVEKVWLQARIRCMIYSTVGEKEESDFPVLSSDRPYVTPPVAIFLTAVLEFLGEHILLTAARFATERIGTSSRGYLYEEDLDRGVRMDKSLGTIWQSYLSIVPMRRPIVHKSISRDTIASTASEAVFSTLPFSDMATNREPKLQNPDQYEQLPSQQDPSLTPVILRKASPGLSYSKSVPPPGDVQSIENLHFNRTDTHRSMSVIGSGDSDTIGLDSLETIPETPPYQPSASPDSAMERSTSALAPLNSSSLMSAADHGQIQTATVPRETMPMQERAILVSREGHAPFLARDSESSHHPQPKDTQQGRSQASESATTYTAGKVAPQSLQAAKSSPSQSSLGFESGVFQWNAQREHAQVLNSPRSLLRQVSQGSNSSQHPQKTPTKNLTNTSNIFAVSASNIAEPNLIDTPTTKQNKSLSASPSSPLLSSVIREPPVRFDPHREIGLGITSNPPEDQGSDNQSSLRNAQSREIRPLAVSDAEAQRSRIVASRESATSFQTGLPNSAKMTIAGNSDQPPASTRAHLLQRSPESPKQSRALPRDPSISSDLSHTLRLAEFLRTTSPEAADMSLKTDGLSSDVKARSPRRTSSIPAFKATRPKKTTKAGSRTPLETNSETDDSERDEELYGPKPSGPKPRQESLVEFLREGPPMPPSDLRKSNITKELASPRRHASLKIASTNGLQGNGQPSENDLIAGPAYSPEVVSPLENGNSRYGLFDNCTPRSPKRQAVLTSPRPLDDLSKSSRKSTTPIKTTLIQDQRASSSRATGSGEDTDDDSIFGDLKRKPEAKESLADFLRTTAPPGYSEAGSREPRSASATGSPSSIGTISRISRRLSSLSILGNGSSKRTEEPTSPAMSSPVRPNHRPLMH